MDIRGEEGTVVEITVLRAETMEEVTMEITRRRIEVQSVTLELKDENVGDIQITEFNPVIYDQFEEAFAELKGQGMEGLIVYLRSNPRGNLATVVDILDL